MQKAMKWLDTNKVKYTFHDYKETGIDQALVEKWLQHLPTDKLINLRSTTYKELPEKEKDISTKAKAIALAMNHNSIVKRPLWDFGDGQYFLGWDEAEIRKRTINR
ncbi:MAG: arsenate reductase [Flavipsychrobacter sp.]|nr:arsenate reductase [Flavipsychrobacter sp.]